VREMGHTALDSGQLKGYLFFIKDSHYAA